MIFDNQADSDTPGGFSSSDDANDRRAARLGCETMIGPLIGKVRFWQILLQKSKIEQP